MDEIQQNQTVVPAAPGWNQVIPVLGADDQVETLVLEPVVAWFIEYGRTPKGLSFAHCEPITAMEGLDTSNGILQRPDGSFGEIVGGDFIDCADVLNELRRRRDVEIQRMKGA